MSTEIKESMISSWKPNKDQVLVTSDGKLFIIYFEKMFTPEKVKIYDRFFIKRGSYEKQLETICKYINFFMNFYDQENEMGVAYLRIKYAIDKDKLFDESNPEQLIDLIYEELFTDSIVKKICQLVEDNYLDDIESSEESKKYIAKEKKHLESLEFTNQHIKILLRISFGMKCIAPIMFHYISSNVMKLDRDSDMIYNFYKRLFVIFGDNVNMYNKLFVYVKAKVLESKSHNAIIFDQRDILGSDEYLVIRSFLNKVLISENVVKYKFNENIVGFQKTILKFQLKYFLKDQYNKNLTEVTSAKNSDGLSGMDKMEMNLQKYDEGLVILADVNIRTGLQRIMRDNDFGITDDEIDYYVKHHKPSPLQIELVYSYWGKHFGSSRNRAGISRREYIILLLILKKRLLIQAGEEIYGEFSSFARLPYILTGNVQDKINTRVIRNNKFVNKIHESYIYENLVKKKYRYLSEIKPDYILSLLSQVINTTFTYVAYEDQELLDKEIEYNEDRVADELLFFLYSI